MDPVTAVATMITAIAEMVTEIVKGQPPAEKQKMWAWFVDDITAWREFFKPKP